VENIGFADAALYKNGGAIYRPMLTAQMHRAAAADQRVLLPLHQAAGD